MFYFWFIWYSAKLVDIYKRLGHDDSPSDWLLEWSFYLRGVYIGFGTKERDYLVTLNQLLELQSKLGGED